MGKPGAKPGSVRLMPRGVRQSALLLSGGCCALWGFNVWADEAASLTLAANTLPSSTPSSYASAAESPESVDRDAALARRRGHTEISAITLPAWDRPSASDAAQRGVFGGSGYSNAMGSSFGNFNGNTDMPPMRVEFSPWARSSGGAGVALGVVQPGSSGSAALGGPAEVRDPSVNGSSVELGLRWRGNITDQRRLDIGAWRRVTNTTPDAYTLTQTNDSALYAARVEMQFPSAKYGGLAPELGAIGMQVNGSGKVVLRAKRGGPMVYYRAKF
jgi:hypothetical protein